MPYKEKGRKTWRAKIIIHGKVKTKRCLTKKEALDWEHDERKKSRSDSIRMVSLDEAQENYLNFVKKVHDINTYYNKRIAIRELAAITGNIPIDEITSDIILNKLILPQKTIALSNKRRKDLRSFFEHCRNFHGLFFNPVTPISKIPQDRPAQPVPTDDEFKKLLMAADRFDRNLLVVAANTGGRKSELLRLTWSEDIDFNNRIIRVGNRKNRAREMRYREIPMNDDVYKALRDQFKTRLSYSDYVFQNRAVYQNKEGKIVKYHPNYGDRYTERRRFMQGLCKRAKVKPMGLHSLRRYFASKLVENGQDLETVRYLLGHANVSTTDRYIYRLKSDMRVVEEAVHQIGKANKKAHDLAHAGNEKGQPIG